jgi:cation transport regulator
LRCRQLRKSAAMPYSTIEDLPISVRRHLPDHAQEIYLSAFNHAWERYSASAPDRVEEIAHRVAWAAVKRSYHKIGTAWVPSGELRTPR